MKKTIFAFLIAFSGSALLSMAQSPQVHRHMGEQKDPKQAQVVIAKHVAEMKVRLSLTDKQAAQMTEIFTQTQADRVAMAELQKERALKDRQEMKVKRDAQKAQIEALLTPAQKEEFAKLKAKETSKGNFSRGMSQNGRKVGVVNGRKFKKAPACSGDRASQKGSSVRPARRGASAVKATPVNPTTK